MNRNLVYLISTLEQNVRAQDAGQWSSCDRWSFFEDLQYVAEQLAVPHDRVLTQRMRRLVSRFGVELLVFQTIVAQTRSYP